MLINRKLRNYKENRGSARLVFMWPWVYLSPANHKGLWFINHIEKTWKLSVSLVSGDSLHSFVTKWMFTIIVISTIIPLTVVITHWKQETAALWQEFSKSLQQVISLFINWALSIYGLTVFILWILSSSFIFSSSLPGCHVAVIPWLFLAVSFLSIPHGAHYKSASLSARLWYLSQSAQPLS